MREFLACDRVFYGRARLLGWSDLIRMPSRVRLESMQRDYSSRRAVTIGRRAARKAGKRPPTSPIRAAYTTPCTRRPGVTLKANATWLNDCQLIVLLWYPSNAAHASRPPRSPPTTLRTIDSASTDKRTAKRPNPSARRVAISRMRDATALYIVL